MAKKKVADATHKVLSPLKHNGNAYAEGDEIALTEEQAAPLLEVKTVEPLAPEKKEATAA